MNTPMEAQVPSEATEEENVGQFPETAPGEEEENIPADGEVPFDALPSDPPDGEAQPGGVTANAAESLSPGDMPGEAPAGEELPAGPFPGDAPLGDMPPGGDSPLVRNHLP